MWRLRRNRRSACWVIACFFFAYLVRVEVARSYEGRRKKEDALLQQQMMLPFDYAAYVADEKGRAGDPFGKHSFNLLATDSEPLDRPLPDSRDPECHGKKYNIPSTYTVSIVISFHNEARSALLRTIVSVLSRSPKEFLKEIVLVDDFSDNESDGWELRKIPKVRIYRNSQRQGLIRSRAYGAQKSSGSHVMFLDSHCEVNEDWLSPLLHTISQYPKALVSPIIDVVDADTFEYKASSVQMKGGFDWSLNFRWQPISRAENKSSDIFKSPVTHGGLFLVNKSWFNEIGGLDKGLEIWGAENIEVSVKTWLCGGQVLSVPCSRVGHVFRKKHPYSFPGNGSLATYLRNSRRVAESWLDDYKYHFYERKPHARTLQTGSIEGVLHLKRKLKCRPFQWYLDNVYPELKPLSRDSVALGQLQQENECLQSDVPPKMSVALLPCVSHKPEQEWYLSKSGELHQNSHCLTARTKLRKPRVYLSKCSNSVKQKWSRRRRLLIFQGMCLESAAAGHLTLNACRPKSFSQQWDFSVELQRLAKR